MKKIIAIVLFTLSFFAGCQKNDTNANNQYYIRFKVNGGQKDYRNQATFQYTAHDNMSINLIMASLRDSVLEKSPDYIALTLNGANIAYLTPEDISNKTTTLNFYYQDEGGNAYAASSLPQTNDAYITMNIQEINSAYIKGTFNAKAYKNSKAVVITDGEFYVKKK